MKTQVHRLERDSVSEEFDRVELLKLVTSLRRDVRSMQSDIQEVLTENETLKKEVDRLRGRRKKEHRLSEMQQLKQEIDQLMHSHEAASSGRNRRYETPPTREPLNGNGSSRSASWMKKMMMFMMINEMH